MASNDILHGKGRFNIGMYHHREGYRIRAQFVGGSDQGDDINRIIVPANFMDADDVYGGTVNPDGDLLTSRRTLHRPPLIRIRSHFVDMMLKSVEDM